MPSEADIRDYYLDLLKRALTRDFGDEVLSLIPINNRTFSKRMRHVLYEVINTNLKKLNLGLGQINRPVGETMMGPGALNNLHSCLDTIRTADVSGDLMEAGVWRGGGCIFMRAYLMAHGLSDRQVWVADSFEGLPKPDPRYEADANDTLWTSDYLAVSEEQVKSNFCKYNLLDERVVFLKGFFSQTMPSANVERLALLRLDGDMYESTWVVLENLYGKVSTGGFIIIDDYGMIDGCNKAVDDFRIQNGITDELKLIGYVNGKPLGAYWQKT